MRILLAEDERALSGAIATILKHNNYSVDNVFDGQTALEYLETQFYDALILDVMMPKKDGIDDNEIVFTDTNKIAAITEETAGSYALELYADGKTKGMYEDYKYRAKQTEQGTLYIFLDCTREMTTFRSFLQASVLISLGGAAIVFVLVIILSKIALKPVEESYRKQKNFITNASHDIKTPLTIINAGTEVIELEHGEGEWTKEIKKQTQRLTSLTDKLVFLSRMDEENQKIDMRDFSLSEVLADAVAPYANTSAAKGLNFSLDLQPDVVCRGNEEMLGRAFALLLDNAMKYTSERGEIFVSLKKKGKSAELRFKNTAEGLETGNHNEIFERFYRSDRSRNSKTGGHGIGLSVVKAIVTAHKGKIAAYCADGKTMEFLINL